MFATYVHMFTYISELAEFVLQIDFLFITGPSQKKRQFGPFFIYPYI